MGTQIVTDYLGRAKPVRDEDTFPFGRTELGGIIKNVESVSAARTLTADDSGKTFLVTAADVVVTLPSTALGLLYTIVTAYVAAGATGVSVSPAAADLIYANPSIVAPYDNKDIVNTIASAYIGDSVTLLGNGTTGWIATSVRGTWAREA